MTALPTGIVTFLFTDIEGSTRLWERDRAAMTTTARRHDALLAAAIRAHDGVLYKHVGDAVQAAFPAPLDAVLATVDAQRALTAESWPETGPIRVRMAIHCGEAAPDQRGDYHQVPSLNRLSRLMSAGYGGQVLLSDAIRQAVAGRLPPGVTLRDLGRHRLRDLLEPEQVTQLVIEGLPAEFPPLKTLEGHPTNLPTLATALLGREDELANLAALLAADSGPRLVTLVGPGGVGKTHLALQAAANLVEDFVDGVWLVRLGEVTDPEMILPAIASALGIREGGGLDLRQALLAWIGQKRVLFVLDNVEQVISGAAVIADFLAASPNARVLATSRQRLAIGGERVVPVQPLPVVSPETEDAAAIAGNAAVRLFLERAHDVAPGLTLDGQNAAAIAAISARLDGLPLAIELAAAQLRTRTLAELQSDLNRRFDLLVGGRREALSHQQSLAATIAWSYERLDAEEQRLLRFCSVFAGGWSREAAEAVGGEGGRGGEGGVASLRGKRTTDTALSITFPPLPPSPPERSDSPSVIETLSMLTEQSLVRRSAADDVSRWSMLESIREFGRARLDETGEAAIAHDRHAAWCLAFSEEAATHLEGAEQEQWLDRLELEHDNARAALRWSTEKGDATRALSLAVALSPFWQTQGHLSEGRRWLEAGLGQTDLSSPLGLRAMFEAGVLAQTQGDPHVARGWYERALTAARTSGDRGREASLLINLGGVALQSGELDEAEQRFSESVALAESLGDQRRRADALANLGATAHYRGETDVALRHYLECLQVWRSLGDAWGAADMLLNVLLLLAPRPEEHARARAAGEESLRAFRALGDPRSEALALSGLGLVAVGQGDLDRAASLHEESLRLARRIEDRDTEARALGSLGLVELDRGNLERAASLLRQQIGFAQEIGDPDLLAIGLEAIAALATARGENERAARLGGAAAALRERIAVPMLPETQQRHEVMVATLNERLRGRYEELVAAGAALDADAAVAEALARDGPRAADPLAASLQTLDDLLQIT